jgi:hypothetical protein
MNLDLISVDRSSIALSVLLCGALATTALLSAQLHRAGTRYLDHFATNESVSDAKVRVTIGDAEPVDAEPTENGIYTIPFPHLARTGSVEVVFNVTARLPCLEQLLAPARAKARSATPGASEPYSLHCQHFGAQYKGEVVSASIGASNIPSQLDSAIPVNPNPPNPGSRAAGSSPRRAGRNEMRWIPEDLSHHRKT